MKGLLLKDYYMARKYCRAYLVIVLVFMIFSVFGNDNLFFIVYPSLFSAMIPVTLLGYDERSKWCEYVLVFPYTKTQIVSAKYIFGLIAQVTVVILISISQLVKMSMGAGFEWKNYITLMSMIWFISCFAPSVSMPFIFKMGVEKGRISYYVMIGVIFAGVFMVSGIFNSNANVKLNDSIIWSAFFGIGVLMYAVSWYLSVIFYKKREV